MDEPEGPVPAAIDKECCVYLQLISISEKTATRSLDGTQDFTLSESMPYGSMAGARDNTLEAATPPFGPSIMQFVTNTIQLFFVWSRR